jgi:hypothetical protein
VSGTGPPNLVPIVKENWRMFSDEQDANTGLTIVRDISPQAAMCIPTTGMYAQYVYLLPNPSIACRLVYGLATDENGTVLQFLEYPSDIYDRFTVPMPFVDSYTPGQKPVLKIRDVGAPWGQLYWTAA